MATRSALIRRVVRRVPGIARAILALSARGALPSSIVRHWFSVSMLPDLFPAGMPVRVGRMMMYVPPTAFLMYETGEYEPTTTRVLQELLRPGMRVVDVGAHAGYYTLLAAERVGLSGQVVAFEPSPATYRVLERNVRSLPQIRAYSLAVGEANRIREFHTTIYGGTDGFRPIAETVEILKVEERRLDDLVPDPVDLVKIDVEGAEVEVMRGMRRILDQSSGLTLLVEWNPACLRANGVALEALPQLLFDEGFASLTFIDDRTARIATLDDALREAVEGGRAYWNILARRSRHAATPAR